MSLLKKMFSKDKDWEDWYKMGNLYIGYIFFNQDIETLGNGQCKLHCIKQGPVICYKPKFSNIFTRISNGAQYLENTYENNSQEIGDTYFDILAPFIDFVHEYIGGFDDATKKDYLDKDHIIKLEEFLMEEAAKNQERLEKEESQSV